MMADDTLFTGVPTMCLLPLKNTKFKVVDRVQIYLPRGGNYSELAPDIFNAEYGNFDLLNVDGLLHIPSITTVLLATGKYPQLEANQVFAPATLFFKETELIIDGMILEILSIVQ